jgi:hypothetical protein
VGGKVGDLDGFEVGGNVVGTAVGIVEGDEVGYGVGLPTT